MKKILSALTILAVSFGGYASELNTEATANKGVTYIPSEAVKKSQKEFAADRFGIFIHWGIYSMFAQGEWYLNSGIREDEYCKADTSHSHHATTTAFQCLRQPRVTTT